MRKILLVVMVLILAAAVVAACSPAVEKPAVPSASTKVPVEIQPTASSEATVATQSPVSTTVAQSGAPASTINAEELTNQRCSECHTMARVRNAAKTPEEWATTVKRMQGKGLSITNEEFDVIVAFLSENYKK